MNKNFKNNDFTEITFGRKSVRLYDENYKISHEEMLEMIQEATAAPSSVNMQPWRFIVGETIPYYKSFSKQEMNDAVKIDASLAAMQLMLVARAHGYETNPIGGFEKDQLAEAFDLDKERYVPVMILSIGKAVEEGYESVRMSADKITTFK